MRALLVANPVATTTTAGTRDVIVRALSSDLEVEVAWTRARGHASELAANAAREGFGLVIALGGDGTVNEIVNGLLADGPGQPGTPALAVVPGGSTNVFARALGLPRDPIEATSALLDAVRHKRERLIGLGRADGRWFIFAAGVGLDAEVVRRVESRREQGATLTSRLYLREVATVLARGGGVPPMTVRIGEAPAFTARMAVFANTRPWTYLGARPIDPFPRASFEAGLDVFAVERLDPVTVTRSLAGMLWGASAPTGRHIVSRHDLSLAHVVADSPFPLELDGEAVGLRREVAIEGVRNALRVLA